MRWAYARQTSGDITHANCPYLRSRSSSSAASAQSVGAVRFAIMDALFIREISEPTFLERSFGETLKVAIFALDDSDMMTRGACLWVPARLPQPQEDTIVPVPAASWSPSRDALFFTTDYDVYVYKTSHSAEISRIARLRGG